MKTWIYSWLIYPLIYSLAALFGMFKPKVRDTLRLRSWKDFLSLRFNVGHPIEYWIHVASHGELEYAIPILQALGRRGKRVLVTYYSISAQRPVEQLPSSFSNVSLVVPLPHDGLGLMKEFVALVRRQGVHHLLLMKYELWPGLLWECNRQGIKVLLVDALKPGWFHRRLLHKLDGILTGYSSEVETVTHRNVKIVGDTRVERVLERVEQGGRQLAGVVSPALIERLGERPVLVCGSMWPPDTRLVARALKTFCAAGGNCDVVWVPHELDQAEGKRAGTELARLGFEVKSLDEASALPAKSLSGKPLALIVMKKGILAELYKFGQAAFVGGGFGSGIHSVWEPALAGAKVACGPKTRRSPESKELAKLEMLREVGTPEELVAWMSEALKTEDKRPRDVIARHATERLADLMVAHKGAAERIIKFCEE